MYSCVVINTQHNVINPATISHKEIYATCLSFRNEA